MSECAHLGCSVIGDGECHVDAEGWMINVTREQHERVRQRLGCPDDEIARTIMAQTDYGRAIVCSLLETLKRDDLGERDRRAAEKQLERYRAVGVPREPWKEH